MCCGVCFIIINRYLIHIVIFVAPLPAPHMLFIRHRKTNYNARMRIEQIYGRWAASSRML